MLIVDPITGATHPPAPGEIFKNPTLANTFRAIGEHGKAGYYEGRIAEAIVERSSPSFHSCDQSKADLHHCTLSDSIKRWCHDDGRS